MAQSIAQRGQSYEKGGNIAFRFEKLTIWTDAIALATDIYLITENFPKEELFSLTSQLRRSVSAISANIAEGSGSTSKKEFCRYLDIAAKSTYEVVSHLEIARIQKYITEEEKQVLYTRAEHLVRKIRSLNNTLSKGAQLSALCTQL